MPGGRVFFRAVPQGIKVPQPQGENYPGGCHKKRKMVVDLVHTQVRTKHIRGEPGMDKVYEQQFKRSRGDAIPGGYRFSTASFPEMM